MESSKSEIAIYIRSNEPGILKQSNHTNSEHLFFGFCLQVFHHAGPPHCLALHQTAWPQKEISVNKRHNTALPVWELNQEQQRIASLGIKSGVSNLSITNPKLYH